MIFCKECGTKHEDDALFCENCGNKLEKPVFKTQEEVSNPSGSTKSPMKYLKVALVVLVVAVVGYVGTNLFLGYNDPGVKLFHGVMDVLHEKNPEMKVEVSFENSSRDYEFLNEITMTIDGGIDKEDLSGRALVEYDKHDLMEAALSYQSGNVFFDLMKLYDETLYLDASYAEENIHAMIQMKNYLQSMDIKGVNWKTYGKIFTDEMGRNIEKDGSDILLTLDVNDLVYALNEMLDEAEGDDDLKDGLQKAITNMLEDMIKDDFVMDYSDKSDWEDALEYMESDWDDAYEELVDDLRDFVNYDLTDLEYSPLADMELRFVYSFNKLKRIETVVDLDVTEMMVSVDLHKGFNAKSYKTSKSENLEEFDDRDMEKMLGDVVENISDNIKDNKKLVSDIEDTEIYQSYAAWMGIDDFDDFVELILDELMSELSYSYYY